MGARARVGLVEACRGGEAPACGMFTMNCVYNTLQLYTPHDTLLCPADSCGTYVPGGEGGVTGWDDARPARASSWVHGETEREHLRKR